MMADHMLSPASDVEKYLKCNGNKCKIEATVPTGFESVAADEAKEMFQCECSFVRGKIRFDTPVEKVKNILKLGGVDHCRVQILHIPFFEFSSNVDECLSSLQLLVKDCLWDDGLQIWQQFFSFSHPISSKPEIIPTDRELIDICYSAYLLDKIKFSGNSDTKNTHGQTSVLGDVTECEKRETFTSMPNAGLNNNMVEVGVIDNCDPADVKDSMYPITCNIDGYRSEVDMIISDKLGLFKGDHSMRFEDSTTKLVNDVEEVDDDIPNLKSLAPSYSDAMPEVTYKLPDTSLCSKNESDNEYAERMMLSSNQVTVGNAHPNTCTDSDCQSKALADPSKPSFRVTCHRVGDFHSFDSMSAAASFGSAVQTYFGWNVDMTGYDIEVVLTIDGNNVSVGLALTPVSLHHRNLVAFGVTTLRPTICHNMLRLAMIKPGHVVCDPMCGTGSISIQGALSFPALQLCGDNHPVAMGKFLANRDAMDKTLVGSGRGSMLMDGATWDVCHLPLRDGVVDVFVSDLPFGKRVGCRHANRQLYRKLLDEMARCCKLAGHAALLTADVTNMNKALLGQRYWTRHRVYRCNIGGLYAQVFLLFREHMPFLTERVSKLWMGRHRPMSELPAGKTY